MTALPMPTVAEAAVTPAAVGLEHRLAFDLAYAAMPSADPMLLIASSVPFLVEGLVRARGRLTVMADSAELADRAEHLARAAGQVERLALASPATVERRSRVGGHRGAIWAAPQAGSWRTWLAAIDGLLSDGSLLAVLAAGPGDRLLGTLRRRQAAGAPARGVSELAPSLAARGYRPVHWYGLGGPASMAWAGLSRLARIARRPALVDRCEAGYRLALATGSGSLALLTLLIVRKAGAS